MEAEKENEPLILDRIWQMLEYRHGFTWVLGMKTQLTFRMYLAFSVVGGIRLSRD